MGLKTSFATLVATAVGSCLILIYVAGFSVRQGIVLGVVFAWLGLAIGLVAKGPKPRFTPYYVKIHPNWPDLLLDYKLLQSIEEWHALQKSLEDLPLTEYRVLRSGVYFTIVCQSEDFERTLVWADNHQVFISEVYFDEEIRPLRAEPPSRREREFGTVRESDIRLFVRPGKDGYNLGIRVPSSWWERVKGTCPKPVEEKEDHPTGHEELTLASISYREFDMYWESTHRNFALYEKTANEIRRRRDEQRRNLGWKTIDHDSELGAELGIDWPETIAHKYFSVEHRSI